MSDNEEVVWPIEDVLDERVHPRTGERQLQVQWGGHTKAGGKYKPQWLSVSKIHPSIVRQWEADQAEWTAWKASREAAASGAAASADAGPANPTGPVPPPSVPSVVVTPVSPSAHAGDVSTALTAPAAVTTLTPFAPSAIPNNVPPWIKTLTAEPARPVVLHAGDCDDRNLPFRIVSHNNNNVAPCQGKKHAADKPHHVCAGCHHQQLNFYYTEAEAQHMITDEGTFPICNDCAAVRCNSYGIPPGVEVNCCACPRNCPTWLCAECWLDWARERTAKRTSAAHCPCGTLLAVSHHPTVRKCSHCEAPVVKNTW